MKKIVNGVVRSLMVGAILIGICLQVAAYETDDSTLQTEILTKGVNRTITVQGNNYPEDFSQFLVVVLGAGVVDVTLSKQDTQGDLIGFTGMGISALGVFPFFRAGVTGVSMTEGVYTGTRNSPFGLLWITTWIISSDGVPPFEYTLVLNLRDVG